MWKNYDIHSFLFSFLFRIRIKQICVIIMNEWNCVQFVRRKQRWLPFRIRPFVENGLNWATLQIQDRSPQSRPVASRNLHRRILMRPVLIVATGLRFATRPWYWWQRHGQVGYSSASLLSIGNVVIAAARKFVSCDTRHYMYMAKACAYSCDHRLWRHAGVGEFGENS